MPSDKVRRWQPESSPHDDVFIMLLCPGGEYVKYSDHLAELERVRGGGGGLLKAMRWAVRHCEAAGCDETHLCPACRCLCRAISKHEEEADDAK